MNISDGAVLRETQLMEPQYGPQSCSGMAMLVRSPQIAQQIRVMHCSWSIFHC